MSEGRNFIHQTVVILTLFENIKAEVCIIALCRRRQSGINSEILNKQRADNQFMETLIISRFSDTCILFMLLQFPFSFQKRKNHDELPIFARLGSGPEVVCKLSFSKALVFRFTSLTEAPPTESRTHVG